ncbi:family 1 glycosylhydrolase [Paenarthrobacter sp. NPDC089989]|uniref:family 1 glycosylhydrolase n=1 Tax=unclassified Paenarthrobacter TaxID=2634190 RepID=UPI0037FBF0A4
MTSSWLWGASTSPHQTEGNNVNSDWWALEQRLPHLERSADADDSYHRYAEDMELLAAAGLNAYRFGIEWARIEPAPGEFALAELAHYRRMIETAHSLGLTPVVTLHHFSSPRWLAEEGGWMGATGVDRFVAYVSRASDILGDVPWLCTINEPNVFALMTGMSALLSGSPAPERPAGTPAGLPAPSVEVGARLVEAHQAARAALKERTDAAVGWTVAGQAYYAAPEHEDRLVQERWVREDLYLEGARGDDFVGVQSYHTQEIGAAGPIPHPDLPGNTDSGPFTPEALGICVRHAWDVTGGTPILVTENGISTRDDARRIEFISKAVEGLFAACEDGIDIRGYLHWSLLDNFEWGNWDSRFGLIEVDRQSFERRPKPSLAWFGEFARRHDPAMFAL